MGEVQLVANPPYVAVWRRLSLALVILAGGMQMSRAKSPAGDDLQAETPFIAETDAAMTKMTANMMVKPSGNADRDFASMMVAHHQGAIAMAQAELQYGHNPLLARMAQEVIAEQLQEIAAMRLAVGEAATATWVAPPAAAHPNPNVNMKAEGPFLAANTVAMNTMMAGMVIKQTGNADVDFVAMMVPHHQGGIDMARVELRDGSSPQLICIAHEIIVDQNQEISMMRLALGEPLPPSVPLPTQASAPAALPAMSSMQMGQMPATNAN